MTKGYKRVRYIGGRYGYEQKRGRSVAPILLLISLVISLGVHTHAQFNSGTNTESIMAHASEPTITPAVTPTPQPTAVPTPTPVLSEKEQIEAYIREVFKEDADNAFKVLSCENKRLNQSAINHNRNGTTDHGIFQINSIHAAKHGDGFKTSWKENIDVAYKIYQKAGNKFRPWTCAHMAGQENYLSNEQE